MRSERLRIGLASVALAGALACSHAQPTPTADANDAGAPTAAETPSAAPAPAPTPAPAPDTGTKLSSKDAAETAPPPKPKVEVRTADATTEAKFAAAARSAQDGDIDSAMASLKEALNRDAKLPWAHLDLGALYERKGESEQALTEYKKALDIQPDFGPAAIAEARLLLRQRRSTEAEGDLRGRVNAHPEALGLRNALVFTLVQEQQYDQAVVEAKKVLKADERNSDAMFQLATVYYKQGKNELALMVLTNASAIRPDDPQMHNAMGFVHIALKEREKALEDFKAAAQLSPDFAEAHNNLGALYNEAQDYASAVHELETAVRDAPDFAAARLNLGNAYRGNQQYDKALSEYQRVLQLHPSDRDALFNLAVLYFDGDFSGMTVPDRLAKADAYFDQYRAAGGDDPKVDQYKKDLAKLVDKEKRRQEREAKDKLKKAEKAKKDAAAKPPPDADAPGAKLKDSDPGTAPATSGGTKLKDKDSPKPAASGGTKLQDSPAPTPPPSGGKLGGGDDK